MEYTGDDRLKWKVVRLDTYGEVVKDAPVVKSDDEAGTCVLMVPLYENGNLVVNEDGTPKLTEAHYVLPCGIKTLKRDR